MHPSDAPEGKLCRSVLSLLREHPGKSGVFALSNGRDAFAARVLLADAAERTLDAGYYIWHNDMSGTMLFSALRRAAARGVRVRLLLDDNSTAGLDAVLAALDAHPNIEVRLFNPFSVRRWRLLGYLSDFARLNRRMHNKSFTADGQATIIGGRNVGDEYFDAGQGVSFADLDVLAIGPVVDDVSRDFDRYWASESSLQAARVLAPASPRSVPAETSSASLSARSPAAASYAAAVAESAFVHDLHAGRLPFEWAPVLLLSDDPAKGLGRAREETMLWPRLRSALGKPALELQLVSAYFVPGTVGVEYLANAVARGVKVAVVTNSLEATDVPAVHVGYAKRRRALLKAGVRLYETKRTFAGPKVNGRAPAGSSRASLHAKTFAVDRSRVFIGSFNFDPRSARLNTEMGFVIDSPALAAAMAARLASDTPERTYEVRLSKAGTLQWLERCDGEEVMHDHEPGTTFWQRAAIELLSILPIEWLL